MALDLAKLIIELILYLRSYCFSPRKRSPLGRYLVSLSRADYHLRIFFLVNPDDSFDFPAPTRLVSIAALLRR